MSDSPNPESPVQPVLVLLGHPIGGNPTQYMMEKALNHHHCDWRYLTVDVCPENLEDAVRGIRGLGFSGGHCDLPHKESVIPLLDRLTERAELIGAVNVIFREGGVKPAPQARTITLGELEAVARLHVRAGRDLASIVSNRLQAKRARDWKNVRIAVTLARPPASAPAPVDPSAKGPLVWTRLGMRTTWLFSAWGPMAEVEMGDVPGDHPGMFVRAGPYVRTMTALDARPLAKSRRILITLCGRCENTGMVFSKDRRTVGRKWGRAPVRIEPRGERLFGLPGEWPRNFKCYALAPDGTPSQEVSIDGKGDEWISLSPEYKTMWYLLTRE